MSTWLSDGRIKYRENIVDGLENAPEAFIGMLGGKNFGKLLFALYFAKLEIITPNHWKRRDTMTEIKIEKKKHILPWMLLAGILAVLAYFLVFNDGKDVKKTTDTSSLINVKENNSTVAAFVRFIEVGNKEMALNHAYTNEALLKLTEATNAMADEIKYDVRADMDKVKEAAKVITKDKFDTSHANSIRDGTNILTNVLEKMQQANYPELAKEVSELKNASDSIKPDVLTLDQKDNIKTFFSKAADLLKKMN